MQNVKKEKALKILPFNKIAKFSENESICDIKVRFDDVRRRGGVCEDRTSHRK